MSKRFESGASKRKRQKEQKDALKRLKPITSFGFVQSDSSSSNTLCEPSGSETLPSQTQSTTCQNSPDETHLLPASSHASVEDAEKEVTELQTCEKNEDAETTETSTETDCRGDYRDHDDVGTWTSALSDQELSFWIDKGPSKCQHSEGPFTNSKRIYKNQTRMCSKSLFTATKVNGETYKREWLVYSPKQGKVYCFVCKLFSRTATSTQPGLASTGFDDWSHPQAIKSHENSPSHMDFMLTYLTRKRGHTLTSELAEQMRAEQDYWKNVLHRVIAVISLLSERGLAFRGDEETFGSPNNGNFMGLLELIAKFDPFLHEHIKQHGNRGSGQTSYLSKTICEEIIQLMADKVRSSIISDIKQAGYFSISVDSTPDVSHVDQLTLIVRFVSPEDGIPTERFLHFFELQDHTGNGMAELILNYFDEIGIDFSKCRGQSYDNAANMSGKYNGVQQRILEKNKLAKFIPCAGHSLNLIGRAAVDSCLDAVNFFGIVNELYCFFSASTKRWATLKRFLSPESRVVQHLSDTRWEAHAKATSAVKDSYPQLIEALQSIQDDTNEKGDTRRQAGVLQQKMEELEFVFMLHLWTILLERFHKVSKTLQNPEVTLNTCANLYTSLQDFVSTTRDNFDEIEHKAQQTLPSVDYKTPRRKRITHAGDGPSPDTLDNMPARERFKVTSFFATIDALSTNLMKRATVYKEVSGQFSFLQELDTSRTKIQDSVKQLTAQYPNDVDPNLADELVHFQRYLKQKYPEKEKYGYQEMYNVLTKDNIQAAFPNVEITLRLFLTLMVTNCSGERSFSRLKRIKNEARSTMAQGRLSDLSILSIESDKLRKLDFSDIIETFAAKKARKKPL